MTAYRPEWITEIAFGFGPYDEPTGDDWVDVSVDVQSSDIERGRTSEFEQFPPSTQATVMRNDDRRYDPSHAAGPHFGELVPNTPIRTLARFVDDEEDPFDVPVWRGLVDGWHLGYQAGALLSTVDVPCTDVFKLFAETPIPFSAYEVAVLADAPWWYLRLGEADGAIAIDSTGNLNDFRYLANRPDVLRATQPVVGYTTDGSVDVTTTVLASQTSIQKSAAAVRSEAAARITTMPRTVEMWVLAPEPARFSYPPGAVGVELFFQGDDTFASPKGAHVEYAYIDAESTYRLIVQAEDSTPVTTRFLLPGPLHDGFGHHVVVVFTAAGATAYLDGVELPVESSGVGAVSDAAQRVWIGNPEIYASGHSGSHSWPGIIDDVSYYDYALSADQVAAHYEAGTTPWDGDTTGQRIERILDLISWPASLRAIDAGEAVLGPADLTGGSVLDHLQSAAAAEGLGARLFIDAEGRVTFHDATRFYRETVEDTVQYTFTDEDREDRPPPDVGMLDETITLAFDDQEVYDRAVVTRTNGSPQTAAATAQPTRTKEVSGLPLRDDRQARQLAERIVFRYSEATMRSDAFGVDPEVRPDDWPAVLALEIGHRIGNVLTPGGVGDPIELQQHVEYLHHAIDPETWTIELHGTPADPHKDEYFTWDGPDGTGWGEGVWR